MDIGRIIALYVAPAIVLISLIEALFLARARAFDWGEMMVSVINFVVRNLLTVGVPYSIATPLFVWAWRHRLATLELNSWPLILALFLGQEFCYYWFHRAAHRVRWFWANHAVHHSPNRLNLSAAYRTGVLGRIAGDGIFYLPLVWLGFPPKLVVLAVTLNLLYQTWIHVTWIPRLGWLEYILNTPSAHRVHHARNLDYLDANYGGVLIIFDRLFGTYVAERDDLPCEYGLVQPQTSYNWLRVESDQWRKLFRDLARARSLRAFFGTLLAPPGWRADGPGETTNELRARGRVAPPPLGVYAGSGD